MDYDSLYLDDIAEESFAEFKNSFAEVKNTIKIIFSGSDSRRIDHFNETIMNAYKKALDNAEADASKKDFYNSGGWINAAIDLHRQCIFNFKKMNNFVFNSKPGNVINREMSTLLTWHINSIHSISKYIPNAKNDFKKLINYLVKETENANNTFVDAANRAPGNDDVKSQFIAKQTCIAFFKVMEQALLGVLLIYKAEMDKPGKPINVVKLTSTGEKYPLESARFEDSTKAYIDGYFAALEAVSAEVKNAVNDDIKEIYRLVRASKKCEAHKMWDEAIKNLMEVKKLANKCDKKLSAIKDDDSTIQNILSHLNPRYLFDTKGTYVKTGNTKTITSYHTSSVNRDDYTYGNTTKTERTVDEEKYISSALNKKNMNVKNAQLHRAHAIIQNAIVYCNNKIKELQAAKKKDAEIRKN